MMTASGFMNFCLNFSRYFYKHCITVQPARESPCLALTLHPNLAPQWDLICEQWQQREPPQMYLETENTATCAPQGRIKAQFWVWMCPKAPLHCSTASQVPGKGFHIQAAQSHKVPAPTAASEQSCHCCLGDAANKFSFGMAQLSGTSSL